MHYRERSLKQMSFKGPVSQAELGFVMTYMNKGRACFLNFFDVPPDLQSHALTARNTLFAVYNHWST
jgi:hypothetical protein